MGVVYLAEDSLVGEPVALKFMNHRQLLTRRGQKLFLKEAQIARRLRHENIVAVHDVSSTPDGIPYLSMEYVTGQSLRAMLRRQREERKLVPVRYAVHVVDQVLAALSYAHQTVMHRDIKPENIMVLPGERVKVLDFGLAKALDDEASGPGSPGTRDGGVKGTHAYASPEQLKMWPIDFRSDLYSTGLILHELFTLRTPIDEPATVQDVRTDVSPALLTVLSKALKEDVADRWQTAGAFQEALKAAFDESYRQSSSQTLVQLDPKREADTSGMVYFEGGCFLMGSDDREEESPQHEAYVSPFYMDLHPVTAGAYRAFMDDTGFPRPKFWGHAEYGGSDQPVIGVTWQEAIAYAAWAGKSLPTEAQWEFAARGKESRKYPWGHQDIDNTRCNYGDFLHMPSMIGMHEEGATPDGLQDMGGNVAEWTLNYFMPYARALAGEAPAPSNPRRVVRGGSWKSPAREIRCAFRNGLFPEDRLPTVGFRCVVNVEPENVVSESSFDA
jgi:formylglycine-generating enzyme required for sulfatase activity